MTAEEVYTIEELSQIMGVSRQTVASWKQSNQIPAKAMTPEGAFIRSVIDPFIEIYKRTPPDSKPSPHTMTTEKNQANLPSGKKGYPLKVKKEAMRLIFEEKFTMKEVAERIGCSVNTIQSWKKKHKKPRKSASQENAPLPVSRSKTVAHLPYEDFVRNYWNDGTKAVDVLLLPPEIGPEVIRYVNEALQYAYDRLSK
jgi:transposase-like protein